MSPVPRPARRCTHPGCTRDQVEAHRCQHHAAAWIEQQQAKRAAAGKKRLATLNATRTPADRARRYGRKWREQRARILRRDDHACQVCARTDRKLHVHHLADTPTPTDEELVSLCAGCHARLHAGNAQVRATLRAGGWDA